MEASFPKGWKSTLSRWFMLEKHRMGSLLARRLPPFIAEAGGWALGRGLAFRNSARRLMAERNLRRCGVAEEDLPRAVQQAFVAYAHYYIDSSVVVKMSPSQVNAGFTFEGFNNILDARRKALGPILALPHVGSWDWAGAWLAQVPNFPVTVVVESIEHSELFEWMASYRRRIGMNVLPATPDVLSKLCVLLEERHVVCLLCDRNFGDSGVEVDFFGEKTKLPAGAALLSRRTGAGIVPAVIYRRGGYRHAVTRPALYVSQQGSLRQVVQEATQTLTWEMERMIREAPSQWHLMQPNWPSDREALAAFAEARSRPGR